MTDGPSARRTALLTLGGVLEIAFSAVFTVVFLFLGVVSLIDLHEPSYVGTFTAEDCEPKPRGACTYVGTWTSDDESIVRHDIYLDGWVGDDGTAVATYRPTGIISDASNNIVHVRGWEFLGPAVPLGAATFLAARLFLAMRRSSRRRRRGGTTGRHVAAPDTNP